MAVKNMEAEEAQRIIKERKANGKYVSLPNFLVRTKLGFERCESLIKCGAMDCFNLTRPTLIRQLDVYHHHRKLLNESVNDLFTTESIKLEKEVVTECDFSDEEKSVFEYETFGYLVSRHPLEFFDEVKAKDVIQSSEMVKYNGKNIKMIGWYMASKRIKTSKGDIMKFLSLEDMSGTFEAVIFPEAYAKYAELTISMGPYVVTGKVDAASGNNIIVETLDVLTADKAKSITEKDRNTPDFFGDAEKPTTFEEIVLVETLGKERLIQAYL